MQAAVYLINRSPTAALTEGKAPYKAWYGEKPDVSKLRIFGSKAYYFIPKEKRNKLQSRSQVCHFVGYGVNGYCLWDGQKILIARDVVVEEVPLSSCGERDLQENQEQSEVPRLAGPSSETSESPAQSQRRIN